MPISERTPLRASPDPTPAYMFMPNPTRVYRSRIRQFQCCVCASVLAAFVVALVVTVSYSVQDDDADNNSSTIALNTLLALEYPLPDTVETKWPTDPTAGQMEQALEAAETSVKMRDMVEISGPRLMPNTPAYRHQKGSIRTCTTATKLARAGYMLGVVTQNLVKSGLGRAVGSKSPIGNGPTMDAIWMPKEVCSPGSGPCSNSPYRTLDGTCNSRLHAYDWGVAMRTYRRILPPDYSDGVSVPRVAVDASPLPSARQISVQIHRPMYHEDPEFSVMLAVWGQFLDHDITATALTLSADGQAMSCCAPGPKHPECFPVSLAAGDPYYHQFNLTCMEFVRSVPAPTCKLGPRQQLNQMTSFIDGSVIYGPNFELSQSLRSFAGGRLKMTLSPDGRELLPFSEDPNDGCNREAQMAKGRYCFMSGDSRANENLHLTSMHLIWARQHNLVAGKLAVLNPTWDDEKLFQEARKIVSAQMQHITYSEFLPIILGTNLMTKMDLSPKSVGYDHSYNPSVDATIANSFAASTFRFAHTLLPGLMKMLGKADNTSEEFVELHRMLFNPYSLYSPNGIDDALRGAMVTSIQQVAPHVSKELTDHLFEEGIPKPPLPGGPPTPCGLDLVSLNIQRGRDHGLPSYPNWREKCGLSRPETFADLNGYMDPDSIARISSIYKSVDDIDMYTGMLAEVPITGGFLGPTVTCLITDQFLRLKQGDRFWYETSEQPQAFTMEQLTEIRKTSLAQIICDNSDGVERAPPQVMRSTSSGNVRVPCEALPHPNYAFWKQSPTTGEFVHPGIYHVMLASSDTVARAPVKAPFIPTKLGANVTSGSIVTDAGTVLWSGTLPVAIPSFSMDSRPLVTVGMQLPLFPIPAYGMIWEGTLSGSTIQGRFSIPQFIHGGLGMLSQKFLNGKFTFNLVVTWNIPVGSSVDISGIYSSNLKLSDSPNFAYMKTQSIPASIPDVSAEYSETPSVAFNGILRKAPLALLGTYSPDKTAFWWGGSLTLTIPPSSSGTLWAENNGIQPERMSPMISTMAESKDVEDKLQEATGMFAKALPLRFGGTVTSGNISAVMPSNETVDLMFPLAIPIPAPKAEGGKTTSPSINIMWEGVLMATSPDNASMTGIFSYSKDSAMSTWINGNFDFQIKITWNATMQPILSANGTFTSSIYFKVKKGYIPPAGIEEPAADWSEFESNTTDITTPATQNAILVLEGNFTEDKSHFIWPGSFSFVVLNTPAYGGKKKDWKTVKASPNMLMKLVKSPTSKEQVGVAVTGGSLSPSNVNGTPWWNGVLPVTFAAPPKGAPAPIVYWKGTLTTTGLTGNLHGTFSFPALAVKGNFSLDAKFLWSTTFTAMVDPNVEYTAAIFFQEVKTTEDSTTKILEKIITEADTTSMTNKIVIVLQGTFSPDHTMFTWYGNAFLNIPVPLPSVMSLNSPPEKSLMESGFLMSSINSVTIGATVVSGKVTASSKDGENITLYNASPPTTFTMPLFLYDITWNGSLSNSGVLKGSFSRNISIFNVMSWSGDFEFQITQLWNTSIATMAMGDLIDSSILYSVSLYLQPVKPNTDDVAGGYLESEALQLIMKDAMANKVVVILQGTLSPDRITFSWMGNVIIRIPLATLMIPKPKPAMLKSTMPTNKKEMLLAPKYTTIVEAMVVSGTIRASKSTGVGMVTVFSGYPPTNIPLPISLNSITWTGSITSSGLFSGTFTAPIFTHGNISAFSFTLWNGDFSLQITSLWNSSAASGFTLDSLVTPGMTYSSSVYLQPIDEYSLDFLNSISESSYQTLDVPTSITPKVPFILLGTFSPDKTSFSWSGKVLLRMPGAMPYPVTKFMPQPPSQESSPEKLQALGSSSYTVIVTATVVSGTISGSNSPGGSKIILFSGSPPLTITLPMKLTGVTWTGSLSGSGILRGVYTVPIFTNGNISTFSVTTWNGEFSFNIMQTWNTSFAPGVTMDSLISPGTTYTTSIYMQEAAKVTETFLKTFNDPDMEVLTTAFSIGEKLSVVLIGTFSPDKTTFTWSGNVLMKIPTTNPWIPFPKPMPQSPMLQQNSPEMLKSISQSSYRVVMSATVVSGTITGSSSSGGGKMILFSGSPPLAITLPMKLTGVTWMGSLSSGGMLRGMYTVPIFTYGNISTFSVTTWSGDFSFNIMQTWNTSFAPGVTMDSLITPGTTYTTSIYMQEAAKVTETFLKTFNDPDIETLTTPFSIGEKLFVVLIGTFPPDKTTFTWSGNVLMKIPTTNPWIPFPKPMSQTPMLQKNTPGMLNAVAPSSYRVVMSATVVSGTITGSSSSGGGKMILFSGSPPLTITLPMKLTGVTWTGSLSSGGMLRGMYTVPIFTNGNISKFSVTTWSGDFSFNIMQTWNTSFAPGVTMDSLISPGTTYTTSIYMQEAAKVTETFLKAFNDPDIETLTTPFSIGERLSVILIGTFSTDKTSFTWSGNVLMKIPTTNPWIPFPKPMSQTPMLQKNTPGMLNAVAPSSYRVVMSATVVSGTITGSSSSGGGKMILFSGSPPLTITLPMKLTGVTWMGSLSSGGMLRGMYTVPIFTYGNISTFSVTTWSGDFSFNIMQTWNTSFAPGVTMDSLITPGTTYTTSIYMQEAAKVTETFLKTFNDPDIETLTTPFSIGEKLFVVLIGTFSPDKTTFTWSGNVLMKIPTTNPWIPFPKPMSQTPMLQKNTPGMLNAVAPSSYRVVMSATVVSGAITGSSSSGGGKMTLFSGSPPLTITLPMKLTGVTWTGSLSSGGMLRGMYTVPIFTYGNISKFSVTTWSGDFSFNIMQTWNTSFAPGVTMDSLITPGTTYTTSIYMQEAAKVTETFLKTFNDPDIETLTTPFSIGEKLFVVLIGTFSPDKTTFTWSGNVLMKIPTTNPWIPFPKPMSQTPMLQKNTPGMLNAVAPSSYRVVMSATVVSGTITGSSSSGGGKMTLFSGSPPLTITLPMKLTGVTWTGSLSSGGMLRGMYTVPVFTNGNISTFSVTSWSGDFSFNIMQTWNTSFAPGVTMDSLISPSTTYTTSIYMQEAAKVTETFLKTFNDPDIETLSTPFSIGEKLSVVLIGTFSPDKTTFTWSGNVLMKIPTSNPWVPFPKPVSQSPMVQKSSQDVTMTVGSSSYRVIMSATVISGTIMGSSTPGGSKMTLFNGSPPITITLPMKLTGVSWKGSLSSGGMLRGMYTVPIFTNGNISTFSVSTWSGDFSFNIMQTWNSSFAPGVAMDSLISPSTTYTTSIYMQEAAKISELLLKTLNNPDIEELTPEYSVGAKASVILIGTFSPDKTSFTWSGDVLMKIPTINPWIPFPNAVPQSLMLVKSFPQKTLQKTMGASTYSVSMGVTVVSGTVTASSSAGGDKVTLFSGSLPVSIELPLSLNGITWSGSLSSSGMLSGMFSAPIFKHGNLSAFSVTALSGEFNLQIIQTWNSSVASGLTMDSLITPGMTYTSSIYMQPAEKVTKKFLKSLSEPTFAELATSSSKSAKVPIILVGTFTPDKTSFMWSGDMIVKLPTVNPWIPKPKPKPQLDTNEPVKTLSQQIQNDILASSKSSVALGATVISGTITGSNSVDGAKVTLFSGSPPLTIAVPMALTSITWTGSLSNSGTLKGTFTAPIFKHGNISSFSLTTWTGEFDLQISQLWNSSFASGLTMESLVSPGMTYTTSILMQPSTKITEEFLKSLSEPDLEESTTSSSKIAKVPVILVGSFSPDKTNFMWSGSVIIKFPVAKGWIPPPKPMNLETIFPNSLVSSRVTATVLSGSISAASADKSPFAWWSGSPPLTIHFPVGGQKSYTATWNGSLVSDPASGTSMLRGVFSLPVFTHGNLSVFSAALWTGDFTLKLQTLLPLPVNALVTPGTQYISRIIFQGTTPMLYPIEQLEETAFSALNNAPIILQGTYSPDRLSFMWSGSIIISFPRPFVTNPPVSISELPTTLIKPKGPSLGVKIVSGSIMAKSIKSDSTVTLFDGSPPANLPLPVSLYDITCNGSLSDTGSLKGYFEVPIFNNSDLSVSSVIWSGNFELQLAVLWNSTMTLSSLINPMVNYSVAVYLQSSSPFSVEKTLFATFSSSKYLELKSNLLAESGQFSAEMPKISVILQGTYSPDKTSFLWSGEAIMIFPSTVTPALQAVPDISKKPLSSDSLFAFKLGSGHTVVAASVAWGSISAAASGNSLSPWWSGGAPVTINLSGMNKYGRVAYGIKWSGSMTSDGFGGAVMRGIFTMPLVHHGNITEFSVQIWNGQFTMQMRLYSNILGLDSLVTSEKSFSSSVYLHHGNHPLNTVDTLMVASPEKPSSNTYRVPIILMGSYSLDGSIYTWNGDILMAFPSMRPKKV